MAKGDEKNNDGKEVLILKARYFLKNKLECHIILNNSWWYNGFIKQVKDTHLIIGERKLGEMPIYYNEIIEIIKYLPFNHDEEA
jgi:hypothetical protein